MPGLVLARENLTAAVQKKPWLNMFNERRYHGEAMVERIHMA